MVGTNRVATTRPVTNWWNVLSQSTCAGSAARV